MDRPDPAHHRAAHHDIDRFDAEDELLDGCALGERVAPLDHHAAYAGSRDLDEPRHRRTSPLQAHRDLDRHTVFHTETFIPGLESGGVALVGHRTVNLRVSLHGTAGVDDDTGHDRLSSTDVLSLGAE